MLKAAILSLNDPAMAGFAAGGAGLPLPPNSVSGLRSKAGGCVARGDKPVGGPAGVLGSCWVFADSLWAPSSGAGTLGGVGSGGEMVSVCLSCSAVESSSFASVGGASSRAGMLSTSFFGRGGLEGRGGVVGSYFSTKFRGKRPCFGTPSLSYSP